MRLFHLAALAAAMALTACLPVTSKVPVGSTVGFKADPTLLGSWRARDPDADAAAFIHIVGNEDGSMTAIVVEPPHNDSNGDWSAYRLNAATLGTNHIVNVEEAIENGKPVKQAPSEPRFVFLSRVTGADTVVLYEMADDATAAAIRAHEIAGEIDSGKEGDVRITADEPALDAFMKTPRAAKLFTKPLVTLTRIE